MTFKTVLAVTDPGTDNDDLKMALALCEGINLHVPLNRPMLERIRGCLPLAHATKSAHRLSLAHYWLSALKSLVALLPKWGRDDLA